MSLTRVWYPQRLADYLWLCGVFQPSTREFAMRACREVINGVQEHPDLSKFHTKTEHALSHQHIAILDEQESDLILAPLLQNDEVKENIRSIRLAGNFPGYEKFKKYVNLDIDENEKEALLVRLQNILENSINQDSLPATDIAWLIQGVNLISGKMILAEHLAKDVISRLNAYPASDNPTSDGGSFRASRNAFFSPHSGGPQKSDWSDRFWAWGQEKTECVFMRINVEADSVVGDFESANVNIAEQIIDNIQAVINGEFGLVEDLEEHMHEVSASAVDVGFYMHIADNILQALQSPMLTSNWLASLRIIFEAYLALIEVHEGDLYEDYTEHGLGKIKLMALKPKAAELISDLFFIDPELMMSERKNERFRDIDLSSPMNGSLRDRATRLGEKDLYDTISDICSAFIHSEWSALRLRYYGWCGNPLHRQHIIPNYDIRFPYPIVLLYLEIIDKVQKRFFNEVTKPISLPDAYLFFSDRSYFPEAFR